jgi:hypothetical protein
MMIGRSSSRSSGNAAAAGALRALHLAEGLDGERFEPVELDDVARARREVVSDTPREQ